MSSESVSKVMFDFDGKIKEPPNLPENCTEVQVLMLPGYSSSGSELRPGNHPIPSSHSILKTSGYSIFVKSEFWQVDSKKL
jgi:hypothetical protein